MQHIESWMWLAYGLGYCAKNTRLFLDTFKGDIRRIREEWKGEVADAILTPSQKKRLNDKKPADFESYVMVSRKLGLSIIGYDSETYPTLLKNIFDPPLVLYIKGDISLLNGYLNIAIVGARKPSAYGVQAVHLIAEELAKCGVVVVSGLAQGLDCEAHKSALAMKGKTIACLGFGHDMCYPACNKNLMEIIAEEGVLVSEYPPGVAPKKTYFLHRNRIIAGLSQGVLIAEARKKSGTMNTVRMAHSYDRDVFAVPGSIFSDLSSGTNGWIVEGAYPVTCAADILNKYGLEPKESFITNEKRHKIEIDRPISLNKTVPEDFIKEEFLDGEANDFIEVLPNEIKGIQRIVYTTLKATPMDLESICMQSKISVSEAMSALLELELQGFIEQFPGRKFAIRL